MLDSALSGAWLVNAWFNAGTPPLGQVLVTNSLGRYRLRAHDKPILILKGYLIQGKHFTAELWLRNRVETQFISV